MFMGSSLVLGAGVRLLGLTESRPPGSLHRVPCGEWLAGLVGRTASRRGYVDRRHARRDERRVSHGSSLRGGSVGHQGVEGLVGVLAVLSRDIVVRRVAA